jgi:CRISPR/Cas system CMR-associated protein Cmr1 (group 7 of RAMP superfamily)
MGDGEEKKYKQYNKTFKIEFFSFKDELIEAIKEHFEAFLANTNFGTRQSKGYGSFYITNRKFNPNLIPFKVYSFQTKNWENDIKLFYQFLRQGINLPRPSNPFYTKPAIFSYAKNKGWTWDKKAIKNKFFSDKLKLQQEKYNSDIVTYQTDKEYLLRDLFGLSSSQEWKSYGKTITKEHKEIERFKSPITFKIVDNNVYFWVNDSYIKILDKTFTIRGNGSLNLKTPKEFDFNDFLNFAININLSKHIDNKFHDTKEYAALNRILKNIKA